MRCTDVFVDIVYIAPLQTPLAITSYYNQGTQSFRVCIIFTVDDFKSIRKILDICLDMMESMEEVFSLPLLAIALQIHVSKWLPLKMLQLAVIRKFDIRKFP